MALILNIETSTSVCSVCISKDGEVLNYRETNDQKSHAEFLTVFIDEIVKEQNLTFNDFDAIAVSMGPGSYTGLRIGVSTAKGLCYAKNLPLIAVNTLQSLANGVVQKVNKAELKVHDFNKSLLVPMIDARRMEVYSAFFNSDVESEREIKAEIIDENSYSEILKDKKMLFFGDGSAKIADTIKSANAIFIENINTSSLYMASLSEKAFNQKNFVDVAYFEPFYLKDFVATVPKKNIFK
ncbi:MAG: tRNA (adenosine(37)-N6)-threonylcarbamoyltransferase complex dimerization subunit type 1 TsaB [Bacteroidales bacterium]|nr:tRNA (adenosine(37)-N6)-threonylcarbamoyltransferase complex dimerization subunit type 1 TsaB [Bacteroidales bacterium]